MPLINKPTGLSKTWAKSGEKREPSDAKKDIGWVAEIPTFQDFNWLDGRQDEFIAHVNQGGIPEWDAETEYYQNYSYTKGSNGNIYGCVATNINVNPVSDSDYSHWIPVLVFQNAFKPTITLTLQNNFANHTSYPTLKASVKKEILFINGAVNIPIGVLDNVVATLPMGYRPSTDQLAYASVQSGSISGETSIVRIATNGEITLEEGSWNTIGNDIIFSIGVGL